MVGDYCAECNIEPFHTSKSSIEMEQVKIVSFNALTRLLHCCLLYTSDAADE